MKLSIKSATGSDKTKFNTTEESTTATILKRIDVTGNVTIDKDGSKIDDFAVCFRSEHGFRQQCCRL